MRSRLARAPALGGSLLSLMAAAAFGVMTPAVKGSLSHLTPLRAAGLAYLAAAATCLAALCLRRAAGGAGSGRRVVGPDRLRLAGIILAGGIAGPWLFFAGLQRLPAHQVAVFQNLEFALTVLAALVLLGERPGPGGAAGLALVASGLGALFFRGALAAAPAGLLPDLPGFALVAAACAAWALDNTLARGASELDPLMVVLVKGAGAGIVLLAASGGDPLPVGAGGWSEVVLAGGVGVGLSLVLELLALRRIGAALNAGLFATGPAFGFLWSVVFLGERPAPGGLLALALCAAGSVALALDRHRHLHAHERVVHTHAHRHDEDHHDHSHGPGFDPSITHVHEHEHSPVAHSHPHVHDEHHRHRH